ncbi:hypothetical protein D1007_05961 [Hordeum vulgare]|nr:hypothetical protein D1007_05961 [Hordeum vulgare]
MAPAPVPDDPFTKELCDLLARVEVARPCLDRYYPNSNRDKCADYIGLFLKLDETVTKKMKAQFWFRFADSMDKKHCSLTLLKIMTFVSQNRSWGHGKFIKREDLEKSKHLADDSFTLRCDIAVISEFRTEEISWPKFVSVPHPTWTGTWLISSLQAGHSGGIIASNIVLRLANMMMWQVIKEEREGYSNIASGKGADMVFKVADKTFAAHRWPLKILNPVRAALLTALWARPCGGRTRFRRGSASQAATRSSNAVSRESNVVLQMWRATPHCSIRAGGGSATTGA